MERACGPLEGQCVRALGSIVVLHGVSAGVQAECDGNYERKSGEEKHEKISKILTTEQMNKMMEMKKDKDS